MRSLRVIIDWIVRSPWRPFILLFILAFGIRFERLQHIPDWDLIPNANRELGAIAISLMQTGQFADPYLIPTGPTAHLPPIYPFILSLIYRWFGLTAMAGFVSMLLVIVAGSLLYAMLPWLSGQLGLGRQAGFIAGFAGALSPETWHGHGEYLTGIVLGLLLVAFLRRWTGNRISWHGSLFLGLAMGAAFHLQPALLTVMLGCLAFELWWSRYHQKKTFQSMTILGIVLACLPWAWRNYTTFQALFFIRSNFGLELRMGNREGAAATMAEMDAQRVNRQSVHRHPTINSTEAEILREVGEIEYMRRAGQEALDWIRTHPGDFLRLTLQRIANVWLGPLYRLSGVPAVLALTLLAFWGLWHTFPVLSIPGRAALIIPLVTYPAVYYFVAYMPRYRAPIDWILLILAGSAVWSEIRR